MREASGCVCIIYERRGMSSTLASNLCRESFAFLYKCMVLIFATTRTPFELEEGGGSRPKGGFVSPSVPAHERKKEVKLS